MPASARDRSVSGDLDDSDLDSGHENGDNNGTSAGRPGRKKNPNSQAARRDQNRIAQREFRLRKQQRIRDLEASVEILSGGKDEALNQLRKIMKDLMQENQVLRQLLRSLSNFIGDGAGGLLPKLGWDMNDFNNFVNRSETDTAWESYQRHKREEPQSQTSGSSGSQKRPAEDDTSARSKRARPGESPADGDRDYPLLVPVNSAVPPIPANGLYPQPSRNSHDTNMFNDLMRGPSGSPMFVPPTSPPNAPFAGGSGSSTMGGGGYSASPYTMPSMNVNVDPALPGMSLVTNNATMPAPRAAPKAAQQQHASAASPTDDDQDPKRHEAYKLIQYHLDNYKRNSAYCLPSSLRPTLVQRTVPHESVIDSILHPELRDRMILLRGRFDLVDCLHDYRTAITIHGDDVLAHSNWEISESWLQRYKFLVDPATLTVVNRWRRERGEPELLVSDYVTSEGSSGA
ncbi:bZIP transcription factor [Phanerochaete sordida]|uniref:BZIP transcription factor n=1 Tax=Phanerochaete sordida TaxID=48140 RepID=A0A9P3L784_9APHY|nr:bZIP transcription factor [Phanerochaete sordida]